MNKNYCHKLSFEIHLFQTSFDRPNPCHHWGDGTQPVKSSYSCLECRNPQWVTWCQRQSSNPTDSMVSLHFQLQSRHRHLITLNHWPYSITLHQLRLSDHVARLNNGTRTLECATEIHPPPSRRRLHSCPRQTRTGCFERNSVQNWFLADCTNGRAYATVLRPSVVCNVMYCG